MAIRASLGTHFTMQLYLSPSLEASLCWLTALLLQGD